MRIRNDELLRLRLQGGYSQEDVAAGCKIDVRTYRRWEHGDVNKGLRGLRDFTYWKQCDILERLLAFFGEPEEALLCRDDSQVNLVVPSLAPPKLIPETSEPPSLPSYVHWDEEERRALRYLRTPGTPVILQGPWRFGKTTLLGYLLHHTARTDGTRALRLCLSELDRSYFASLDTLLRALGLHLLRALDPDQPERAQERVAACWHGPDAGKSKLTWLLERHVLSPLRPTKLLLALERTDRLEECPFRHDFFALLRGWAEKKSEEPWSQLRLLVTLSTEPTLLEDSVRYSPFFALTRPIRLERLQPGQLGCIARQYGHDPDADDFRALVQAVGAHPHLIYMALEEEAALLGQTPLGELLRDATTEGGIFHEHLRSLEDWLRRSPGLLQRFAAWLRDDTEPLPFEDYCKLYSSGLLVRDEAGYRLRCPLYQRHFTPPRLLRLTSS